VTTQRELPPRNQFQNFRILKNLIVLQLHACACAILVKFRFDLSVPVLIPQLTGPAATRFAKMPDMWFLASAAAGMFVAIAAVACVWKSRYCETP
jgi:hypothetical protein